MPKLTAAQQAELTTLTVTWGDFDREFRIALADNIHLVSFACAGVP